MSSRAATAGLTPGQLRGLGISVGVAYLYFMVLHRLPRVVTGQAAVGWYQVPIVLALAPGVLSLFAFVANRLRLGTVLCAVAAIGQPVAVLLWPLLNPPGPLGDELFWFHEMPVLPTLCALIALPVRWILPVLLLSAWPALVVQYLTGAQRDPVVLLMRALADPLVAGFFVLIVLGGLRMMRSISQRLEASLAEHARTSVLHAHADEIERLDRLTHDHILSLLSAAAEGVPTEKLAVPAEQARRRIAGGFQPAGNDEPLRELAARITARAHLLELPIASSGDPGEAAIARPAATELESAVEEAMRNVVQHARGGRVRLTLAEDRFEAVVSDDGPGFVLDEASERLGVRHSILRRVNTLSAGRATVDCAPGRGTVVTVVFRLDGAPPTGGAD